MLTLEQIEQRRHGVGASEMAAICGLNPYRSALDVYLEKVGITEPFAGNERTEWGNRLEKAIAKKYAETHEITFQTPDETTVHPEHPWLMGTPDRLITYGDAPSVPVLGLEIKTVGLRSAFRWGEAGDDLPEEYLVQCHVYMAIFGIPWDVAVLIGGQEYREYRLEPDPALEARLIEIGSNFWHNHVEKRIPPAPDSSEASSKALGRLYPRDEGPMLAVGAEGETWANALKVHRESLAAAEGRVREAENKLKAMIGEAAGIKGPWGHVTWKATKDRAYTDYKAIVAGLNVPPETIEAHTERKPGSRRFLVKWAD